MTTETSEFNKKCWICLKIQPDASLLPKNFGSHCPDYENKWNNAINKQYGKRVIISSTITYDYTDDLCAPICFNCAH